jgi:transposase InsO family protein
LKGNWVSRETRDEIVTFVQTWQTKTEYDVGQFTNWLGISRSKYYSWVNRQGKENQPNGIQPKHHWLTEAEKAAIINYHAQHPQTGYRRLTYMMLDENVVAVSPSSVYRVLHTAGLLRATSAKPSKKGTGFHQPKRAHQHWHIDITYINICGTFYYLCTILDGYSRYIVHWELRNRMTEADVEIVIQRAREKFPKAKPRIISDNGPQFIARDFKHFIRLCEMQHVRISPYYPQSNGKIERWHQTLKQECIRPGTPLTLEDAHRIIAAFVEQYNHHRLHSAIGYVTPADKLNQREAEIFDQRRQKLAQARSQRKLYWQESEAR